MSCRRQPIRKYRTFRIESLERRELMSASPWQDTAVFADLPPAPVAQISDAKPAARLNASAVDRIFSDASPRGKVPADWQSNLAIGSVVVTDNTDNPVSANGSLGPLAGDSLYVKFRWFTHNLHEGKSYSIKVLLDGKGLKLPGLNNVTHGAGTVASEFYSERVFGRLAIGPTSAGQHTLTVILNPTGALEEGRTDDNRRDFRFQTIIDQPDVTMLRALDDIHIRGVPDVVWSHRFPGNNRPIADGLMSQSFMIRPTFDFGAYRPEVVQVRYSVSIDGVREAFKTIDSSGLITVQTPRAVGVYQLQLEFMFHIPSENLFHNRQLVHKLYVTLDDPSVSSAVPERWLTTATTLAKGASTPLQALQALNNGLYELAGKRGWDYSQRSENSTPLGNGKKALELLYGSAKRANCTDMVNAWKHLADVLGVENVNREEANVGELRVAGDHGKGFLSRTGLRAFDGKEGNARSVTASRGRGNRWYFDWHQLGSYTENGQTTYFDPTFKQQYSALSEWRDNLAAHSLSKFPRGDDKAGESVKAASPTGSIYTIHCKVSYSNSPSGNSVYTYKAPLEHIRQ
jgi:hypothetical protein